MAIGWSCFWFATVHVDSTTAAQREQAAVPNATAADETDMKPYAEVIANSEVTFEMLPIPGGKFWMGSPVSEPGRQADEGPRHEVTIAPFWMGKCEVTWNEYEIWMFSLDAQRREMAKATPTPQDLTADAITRPTKPYTDMTFGMGKSGFPAICMTQYAAKTYCKWLSAKTGRYYRLPTEAEWEYACRAGSEATYSFGNDVSQLGEYAWYFDNSDDRYHKVGSKKPNAWGLHDMHGNVAEWVLDQYIADFYEKFAGQIAHNPLAIPSKLYPQAVRGGSWDSDAEALRSAARAGSKREWKRQDPQLPQSVWYFTDALFLGFRVVRPLEVPSAEEQAKSWDAGVNQ
jgi:formylglycine-generating enzyme required for sulfatase activity